MRKRLISTLFLLTFLCLWLVPQPASAELVAGVQLGYGHTRYPTVLGTKNLSNTEWSAGVWANYMHEDLLFNGFYQGNLGLQDFQVNRSLAHLGASYLFLEEDILKVYGGLGYQLVSTRFSTHEIDKGKKNTLTGHGFTGQVVVDIDITDELKTTATVVAAPWTKWSHSADSITTSDIKSGNTFTYKLEVGYDFSSDFGLQVSVLGNTYKMPSFSKAGTTIGETKSSSVSFNLGLTRQF